MSPDAKFDIIIETLRQRILEREYGTAGRLPSFRMLADQFNTTHETMNKVIQRLQAEGLLISFGRAGVFVNFSQKHLPGITPRFDQFLLEQGLSPVETDIDEPSIVPAPLEVASIFNIPNASPVVRRYRRQGTTTTPYRLAENFYPPDLVSNEILTQLQQDVHFDILEAIKNTHGLTLKSIHEDVYARLATTQEEALLNIVRNTPVFEIQRISKGDDDGIAIMFSRIVAVARYFVLTYNYVPYWVKE
jgi:DNA-binding GntR family transcriptional regulator